MPGQITTVTAKYLQGIYRLQVKKSVAKTSDMVELLGVAPGTVTNTVERLEREGLVTHEPYKGVMLTEKGRRIALRSLRRHRLSERLLTDILHMDWDKAHRAASVLEHGITSDIAEKIEKALGHPITCPHGNPIPTKCGGIIEEESEHLTDLMPKERGIVLNITEEREEVLHYLSTLGFMPGVSVEVVEKAPFDGPITVNVNGSDCALSRKIAALIMIKKAKESGG